MQILSFDGGGIRGVLTAQLMSRLEQLRPGFLECCEFFAGTSIGSINAACFAAGLHPADVVEFFREWGPKIFASRDWLDSLSGADELLRADFDNEPLKEALESVLGAETTLGQLQRHLLVPTFDLEAEIKVDCVSMLGDLERERATRRFRRADAPESVKLWKPKYMHNFGADDENSDRSIKVVDACMRSSAAPTYFPTYQGCIDGGMMDNNPAMSALAKAVRVSGSITDHSLLSVGTGFNPHSIEGDSLDWGYKQWLTDKRLLNILFDGQIGVPDYQVRQLLNGRYRRLDVTLSEVVDLADVDKIDFLVELADSVDLTTTLEWLDNHWMEGVAS